MDMDYDYDREEAESSRYRPQSRQSQHDASSNGYPRHPTSTASQRRGQSDPNHGRQQQERGYAYQEGQFDEPERGDDEMW